ncbi:MAG: hypothetical protein RLZZ272_188 [Actinomycetota bacterium]
MRSRLERSCVRPGCSQPPVATLRFAYDEQRAWLEPLVVRVEPGAYDLCDAHAERTRPPNGWALSDRRPRDPQPVAGSPPIDPGSDVAPVAPGPTPTGPEAVSEDRSAPAVAPGVDRGVDPMARPGAVFGEAGPLVTRATRSSSVPVPRALIPRPDAAAGAPPRPSVWDRARAEPHRDASWSSVQAGRDAGTASLSEAHEGPASPPASRVLDAAHGTAHPLPLGGITW